MLSWCRWISLNWCQKLNVVQSSFSWWFYLLLICLCALHGSCLIESNAISTFGDSCRFLGSSESQLPLLGLQPKPQELRNLRLRWLTMALRSIVSTQVVQPWGFAIGATVALVLARTIITSAGGGCCSCCRTIPDLAKLARVCIVISWITSSVAVILFIAGAKLSTQKEVAMDVNGVFLLWHDKAWDLLRGWYHGSRGCASLYSVLPLLCVGCKRLSQDINGRARGTTNY
ncbi:unnamed protein product [Lactuca saligna]|uniref:Uncharacterized protein n=1 Tax=Lactuca saligna TaxID=75948 RepID=A0AA35ZFH1_LACSI|nr:unnamed protein product [Lactuca saligna]